jgi:hypothetical protein
MVPTATRTPATHPALKSACPKSYSYACDDATSSFTCNYTDYTITLLLQIHDFFTIIALSRHGFDIIELIKWASLK